MDSSILIVAIFVGAGLLACVIIPGLILMWDWILDAVAEEDEGEK